MSKGTNQAHINQELMCLTFKEAIEIDFLF